MWWPKRFKLHEAADTKGTAEVQTEVIQVVEIDGKPWATAMSSAGLAVVPILEPDERSGADLPRLERGEETPFGLLPPKSIQEASAGTTDVGHLRIDDRCVEAQKGDGKPRLLVERPYPDPERALPPAADALAAAEQEPPEGFREIHLKLDAEALANLSKAIGATEGVVLRFLVDQTGRITADAGIIDVRPIAEPNGARAVLGAMVSGD